MSSIIVVDDEREFTLASGRQDAAHYDNSKDAIAALWKLNYGPEMVDELWLDHDLGFGDNIRSIVQGMSFLGTIGYPLPILKVFIHTANPSGQQWMLEMLQDHYDVTVVDANEQGLIKL